MSTDTIRAFVVSATHRRNLKVTPVAHIADKQKMGLNYFPICGRLFRSNYTVSSSVPSGISVCPRCARIAHELSLRSADSSLADAIIAA